MWSSVFGKLDGAFMNRNQIVQGKSLFVERAIKVMGENRRDLLTASSVRRHRLSADCAFLARFQAT